MSDITNPGNDAPLARPAAPRAERLVPFIDETNL